ncbi:hypothetical protein [Subtercola boreus]|nr:hypothetical protein [Subtercola boreus]
MPGAGVAATITTILLRGQGSVTVTAGTILLTLAGLLAAYLAAARR